MAHDLDLDRADDFAGLMGETGRRLAAGDAYLGLLGPTKAWPQAMRHTLATIMGSGFPMFLVWGPGRALLYNDAYAPILGKKHPNALGRSFWDVWPEVRPQIEPIIDAAFTGRSSFFEDLEVSLTREAKTEPAWFTFSYSPIVMPDGTIEGALCVCVETTTAVVERSARKAERDRLKFLTALAAATSQVSDADEVLAITTQLMVEYLSLSDCAYADMDEDEDGFTIRGDFAAAGSPSIVGHYSLADFGGLAVEKLSAGEPLIINNNLEDIASDEAATFQAIGITATICMPLIKNGRLTALMAIHDNKPRQWTPDELDLLREVTARSWDSVQRTGALEALRQGEEQLRLVVEAGEVGIWDLDVVNDRLFWPPRVKAMFGIADDADITMADYYNGLHPDDRDATLAAFNAALDPRRRAIYDVEYRTIGKDDQVVRWVAAKGRGIFEGDLSVALRQRRPSLPVLLSSGHAEASKAAAAEHGVTVLRKPYDIATLARALKETLDQPG